MLREGHRPARAVQPADPARRDRVYDADCPRREYADDRNHPARHHLERDLFSDRRRGHPAGQQSIRSRFWRRRAISRLSRRSIPAKPRQTDLGVVKMRKLTVPALWLSVDLALITAGTLAQAHVLLKHVSSGVGSCIAIAPPTLSTSFSL